VSGLWVSRLDDPPGSAKRGFDVCGLGLNKVWASTNVAKCLIIELTKTSESGEKWGVVAKNVTHTLDFSMSQEAQTLFAGTFERSMDAKKRVAVPSAWLGKKEGEEFYVVPHPSGDFLIVMPPEELHRWEQKFIESDLPPHEQREAMRLFFGAAHKVSTDGQGRVLLREDHCEEAGLKGAVVFAGGRSRFEVWDKDRYAAAAAKSKETYRKAALAIGL